MQSATFRHDFCTAVTCMDGRIQDSVASFLRDHFQARWVDTITEAGPVGGLAAGDPQVVKSVESRVEISVERHASAGIAVIAHEGCAAVSGARFEQEPLALASAECLRRSFPEMKVVALWVKLDGTISLLT
jgi:hypothetical protein